MTKAAALHRFFSSFGISAHPATSVVNENGVPDVTMPYLTYLAPTGSFNSGPLSITVNLYYRTESEAVPNAKVEEISERIGDGGVQIPCDRGSIWLTRGSPWSTPVSNETDPAIKQRYINVTVVYNTPD